MGWLLGSSIGLATDIIIEFFYFLLLSFLSTKLQIHYYYYYVYIKLILYKIDFIFKRNPLVLLFLWQLA